MLFALLVLAHAAPFLVFTYFPSQDGPAHLNGATALHDYLVSPDGINGIYYELNDKLIANWATNSLMAFLVHFVPPLAAEKALLIGYVLFFAIAVRSALGVFGPAAQSFAVLIFPFIGAWTLHMGFYNFSYSLPLFFVVLASILRSEAELDTRGVVRVAAIATVLCLVHPVSFAVSLLSASGLAIWYGLFAARSDRRSLSLDGSVRQTGSLALRRLGTVTLAFAPGIAILLSGGFASGWSPRLSWLEPTQLWGIFTRLETLAAYVEDEFFWTQALLLFFGVLAVLSIARRRRSFALRPSDGLLLLTLALLGLYFVSPDWALGVGSLNLRLLLYPFFALLLWFGAQVWPVWMRIGVQLVGAAIALALLGHHVATYADLNEYLEEYMSVTDQIQPGRTILPLTLNETTPQLEPHRLHNPVWPFLHAAGYLAAARRGVYLNDYEALMGRFPLRFRPEVNPQDHIGRVGNIPPDVVIEGYGDRTPGSLDYIVVWKVGPWSPYLQKGRKEYENITGRWDAQLQRGFEVVSVSAQGHMTLWRAKQVANHSGPSHKPQPSQSSPTGASQ